MSVKLTLAYSILIVLLSAVLTGVMYVQLRNAQRQAIRERLLDIVSFATPLVDGDFHSLIRKPGDENSSFYQVIFLRLKSIQATSDVIKYIYTLRQADDGSLKFVVDADPDPATRAQTGQLYQNPTPLLRRGLDQIDRPVVEDDFYTDEWGTFLSGYAPIYDQFKNLDGVLGIDIDASTIVARENQARNIALIIFFATVPPSVLIGWLLARRMTSPVFDLDAGARRISQGQLDQAVPVRSRDELGRLAEAFNAMQAGLRQSRLQLQDYARTLEQQVASRTREAERRAAQIALGAEVARFATTILEPDQLIAQVAQLIRERFDYYYVGVFLTDPTGRYAVLQYGTGAGSASDAGRLMKERGHKLEIGGQSMIGWACANRQARIALDVGQDAVRFANPLLPDTHSEMALPLRVGERVIGALSVQSTQTAAFDQSDIAALQGMADQIAVALENARLFQQTQKTLSELDQANRLLARQGWQSYLAPTEGARSAEFRQEFRLPTGALPSILDIPLEMRGQIIGRLVMERGEGDRPWTDDEAEAVRLIAQQATLALDGARLFEQAQRLAARERLINEITARIRSSTTLEGVLNAAVREISLVTQASHAAIDLDLGMST